jgi:hypothetical protein
VNRPAFWSVIAAGWILCLSAAAEEPTAEPLSEYQRSQPRNVVALQQFRTTTEISIQDSATNRGLVSLKNLNPHVNTWFLLSIAWESTGDVDSYHLENLFPDRQRLVLDSTFPSGLVIETEDESVRCDLWSDRGSGAIADARAAGEAFAPLCGGRLYLRNPTTGHKTSLELATDLLRRHVPGGETITAFVREEFYQDKFLSTAELRRPATTAVPKEARLAQAPARPLIDPRFDGQLLTPPDLGIHIENEMAPTMQVGRWYRVREQPGMFVSVTQPRFAAPEVIALQKGLVPPLDEVEPAALVYLIAFDLGQFRLDFALGTEHPNVDWSERVLPNVRNDELPGPDGFATVEPLVRTGMVSPTRAERVAAAFIGGFKRYHGAFHWGNFATKNSGTHYGFVEEGTVLSKLQPGLSTVVMWDDDRVELKTWTEADNGALDRIRHARQNGVPIIEYDAETGSSRPGSLVKEWSKGNWSGSAEKRFRTVRAGLGIQEHEGREFLVYGYFSAATTAAMVRVFAAYQCRYAMLLDINALEHTYLAVYRTQGGEFRVQHLIKGMEVLDKTGGGQTVPRFIGYADNRDFFYLRRKAKP